jgi:hypothetical protein
LEHPEIPIEIAEFLKKHIDSVMQLEVLLLVRTRADKDWLASDVASELRIDQAWTETTLAKFANAGILERSGSSYRFTSAVPEMQQRLAEVARLYDQRRVTIISMIFSEPADPIRQFTDAFRFRKEE